MTEEGVPESRFYMWRAVFALAHADGRIQPEEIAFIDKFLANIPFSSTQQKTIMNDAGNAQDVGDMLSYVTNPEDQSMFFEFARQMAVSDNRYDDSERDLIESYLEREMEKFNLGHLTEQLGRLKEEAAQNREAENQEMAREAQEKVGLGKLISAILRPKKSL